MELSILCDIKIFLFIYDTQSKTKLLHYQTEKNDDFSLLYQRENQDPSKSGYLGPSDKNAPSFNPKYFYSN